MAARVCQGCTWFWCGEQLLRSVPHRAPSAVHGNSPSMGFLDLPAWMGSERFWAKEVVIATTMIRETTLNNALSCREVWTWGHTAQLPHSRLKYLCSGCWECWLLTVLRGDSLWSEPLWLKRAALPKATSPSGEAYSKGLHIPWSGWLTAGPCPSGVQLWRAQY